MDRTAAPAANDRPPGSLPGSGPDAVVSSVLGTLRDLVRWRRARIAALVSLLVGLGLLLVPQFDVLAFEAAFAVAVIVPIVAGVVAAGLRRSGVSLACPWAALGALVVAAELLVAIPLAFVAANMLRAPICDPLEGLLFFLLLPAFSAALAAVVGWFLALSMRSSARATALWVVAWLLSVGLVLYRFYATPGVSFLGPFFGLYPGVLYDTLIRVSTRLLTYRATNLVEAGLLLAVAAFAWDAPTGRLSARRLFRSRVAAFVVPPVLGLCAVAWVYGPELGHRTETRFIGRQLGRVVHGSVCDVYGPAEVDPGELRLLADDCEFRVAQIRRLVGLERSRSRITVLAFRSEDEKAALMGAGRTSIAKPWRREVYIQGTFFPHRVLKHELAHVLLGELCAGPFHVPARWGGLLPLPGLIEGGAMAAEWPVDELDPHGWAAAMDRLGLLPPAETLVGVGFLGENAGLAYTATGSFVRWLIERGGTAAFRRVFPAGDFDAAYGKPLGVLWAEWREWLSRVPLDDAQLAMAESRFDVPGFFAMRCPHAVARATAERDARLEAGDPAGAFAAQDEACRLSGDDPRQRIAQLALAVAADRPDEAERLADRLAAQTVLGTRLLDVVRLLRADAAWLAGRPAAAAEAYEEVLPRVTRSVERRLLLAKLHAARTAAVESQLRDYLVGTWIPGKRSTEAEGRGLELVEAAARAAPDDAVVSYLLGRALLNSARFAEAVRPLRRALELGLAPEEFRLEALALLALLGWHEGDFAQTERAAALLAVSVRPEYRAEGGDWLERIRWKRGW